MKRLFNLAAVLLMLAVLMPVCAKAQQMPAVPADKDVRVGKLPNGLTYYIRHNEYPKGQADFYIAQKVGSILEDDNQRGLAHFLEHMCFNGTTNFPGKNLINWLESVGVKFGQNLNAYTSVDQTVYNISNVPVDRVGVQDSCLLILHDWANDLLLLPEEIDAERGVIHQEWRRSMVGQMRILENLLPTIYPNSRYGYRLPIGTMEVVDNFPPQALRDYYEKWYRPDQQGVIVVGDIDVDRIEAKIKEMFSNIEMPENPAERIYFPVEDTEGTIYAIGHDKEQTNSVAQLMIKSDVLPVELRGTMAFYAQNYITDMICNMMDTRLNDISSKPGAPFAGAGMGYGNFFLAKTKDAITLYALAKTTDELPSSLAAVYRELLRAVKGGFTQGEYDRAKSEYVSRYEKAYNNRESRETRLYVQQYVDNFLDGEPMPSVEDEYNIIKQISNALPLAAINQTLAQMISPDNRVVMALMPDNEAGVYPTEEQFKSALQAVENENIEAFTEDLKNEPLIASLRKPGKIVKEQHNDQWDATELTLSNGVKVLLKHTEFKKDEILFNAVAVGGTSALPESQAANLIFMPAALQSYGLGTYSNADLQKYLAGKQASVRPSFGTYTRNINGSTTPKDLPTLMELIYAAFTEINFTTEEFDAAKETYIGLLHNQEANPQYIFQTKLYETLYKSPRQRALSVQVVKDATRQGIVDICAQMTANAADYDFTFVGNFDLATIKPLIEKYIASLPANAKKANRKVVLNPALSPITGVGLHEFTAPMQTPQTWVYMTQYGTLPYTAKDAQLASASGQILSKRLLDIVREKEGAVYSIGAMGSMDRVGDMNTEIISPFPMKPEMKQKVLGILEAQMQEMTQNVETEELAKVKEFMIKTAKENQEKNSAWLSGISGWRINGVDTFHPAEKTAESLTVGDVQNFMKALIGKGNYQVIVLDPAE